MAQGRRAQGRVWRRLLPFHRESPKPAHVASSQWQSVTKIDTSSQSVSTSTGTSHSYDHLIIAPGGKPKKIPIDGKDLDNVLTLRHVEDTKAITSKITSDTDVVIIGTSFIGMEVASAIKKKEPKSVTLVGVDEIPFKAILGEEIGKAIMEVSCQLTHAA
jgi:NADPH-dependent 2,4-dienoyl-CoA reductase/sulfur reductase-like enzyme